MASKFNKAYGCPTAAEVAEAEKFLAAADIKTTRAKSRAKQECMKEWAKKNLSPEEAQRGARKPRAARQQYLQEYLVMSMKSKGSLSRKTLSETHTHNKDDKTFVHEWNSEIMDEKLGKLRGPALRAMPRDHPKALRWVKCPFTGSEQDPMRIWHVPEHVVVTSNKDSCGHELRGENDADASDLNTFAASSGEAAAKPSTSAVIVKLEELSREEQLAIRGQKILADRKPEIRKLQDDEMTEAEWSKRCGDNPFKSPLVVDVGKNKPLIVKTLKLLHKINNNDENETKTDLSGLNACVLLLEQIEAKHENTGEWAVTYGVADKSSKSKTPTKE